MLLLLSWKVEGQERIGRKGCAVEILKIPTGLNGGISQLCNVHTAADCFKMLPKKPKTDPVCGRQPRRTVGDEKGLGLTMTPEK